MERIQVLDCRLAAVAEAADAAASTRRDPLGTLVAAAVTEAGQQSVAAVGPRPDKSIDQLLTGGVGEPAVGRVVVIGVDADLAAVVDRLRRRELLAAVVVGYATSAPTPVTDLHSLPTGLDGLRLALRGEPDTVVLVRNDVGGVLLGRGELSPVMGTVYVDEHRVLRGEADRLIVYPDPAKGLEVTVAFRRVLGFGRRPRTTLGRAVQIGCRPALVVSDGVTYPRPMARWTFYRHTEPLRLVRGVLEA